MGQELECRLHYQRRSVTGKAYLETDHILFRGEERLKIPLRALTSVEASSGMLRLEFPGGPAELELGKASEKWRDKILHPPSRLDKLGIKPGLTVRLIGRFETDFLDELGTRQVELVAGRSRAHLIFFAAERAAELKRIAKLSAGMQSDGALWVVYPKGVPAIREVAVLQAGRDAGLKDVKVCAFSATLTGLKFVVPVDRR